MIEEAGAVINRLRVLFCADPMSPGRVDPLYEAEYDAARQLGVACDLLDYESLVDDRDPERAVRMVPGAAELTLGVYRGWMLRPEQYGALHATLGVRGVRLINDPAAYALCHYLPNWYPKIQAWTPRSSWLRAGGEVTSDQITSALRELRRGPVIVKDYVESQKHYWDEACFIPSSADTAVAERVVRRFLELQGPDLNEGLVFREFEEFVPVAAHSRSGMPLTREYRVFFLDGELILSSEYWDEGDYTGSPPPLDQFRAVAPLIQSRFFTMDLAQQPGGRWRIVELGDGQVAGLPESADPLAFHDAIVRRLAAPA